jgi:hypothetical protein
VFDDEWQRLTGLLGIIWSIVLEIGHPSRKRGVDSIEPMLEARFESVPLHESVETV